MTDAPYLNNGRPAYPGAWLINGKWGALPIFNSIPSLATIQFSDFENITNTCIIMPGFKLILYDGYNYSTSIFNKSNTTDQAKYYDIRDDITNSCQLFDLSNNEFGYDFMIDTQMP